MDSMSFDTLDEWLRWQESLHPEQIELGLERVAQVWARLHAGSAPFTVISVAGTNGKGSCVMMLESILRAAGYRVGAYTSPHLLRYNERIRIDGREIDDASLMQSFERVEAARGSTTLTYFEFGTLAALDLFRAARIEIAVLEVGLGGRLDAVNIIDADVALLTSVGIDHVEWLGPDREHIGREKAGIFRRDRAAVCADREPPDSVRRYAAEIGAQLQCIGADFDFVGSPGGWQWQGFGRRRVGLPYPALRGAIQTQNASAVVAVLELLSQRFPVDQDALRRGLQDVQLPARFQILPGAVDWILDVAHNPHGARVLAANLAARTCAGRTHAVIGMLRDKDASGVAAALDECVQVWYAAGLPGPRGLDADTLTQRLRAAQMHGEVHQYVDIAAACAAAAKAAQAGDRVLVLGSFVTVAEVMRQRV